VSVVHASPVSFLAEIFNVLISDIGILDISDNISSVHIGVPGAVGRAVNSRAPIGRWTSSGLPLGLLVQTPAASFYSARGRATRQLRINSSVFRPWLRWAMLVREPRPLECRDQPDVAPQIVVGVEGTGGR
jgi:hypothetical protein